MMPMRFVQWLTILTVVSSAAIALLARPIPVRAETIDAEIECLARNLYWEARTEGRDGMIAVGWVVLNRQRSEAFPSDVCAVIHQGGETPPCQFSWWCDGRSDRPREMENWSSAVEVAELLLRRPPPDPTEGALFFHHADIDVPWKIPRVRSVQIGQHVFYR